MPDDVRKPSSLPDFPFPEWQPTYFAALAEFDESRLLERIKLAEELISKRLQTMPDGHDHEPERQAIFDALNCLHSMHDEEMRRK